MSTDQRISRLIYCPLRLIGVCCLLLPSVRGETGEPAPPARGTISEAETASSPADIARLIGELDSDRYHVRRAAADRLRWMANRPGSVPALAQEFQRVLVAADTSFEVRRTIQSLSASLPPVADAPPPVVPESEIEQLVRQLDDNDFGRRLSARRRLEWLAGHPKLVCPILLRAKARMDTEGLTVDARRWIEPVYSQVRRAWLTSDPKFWTLPPVSDAQIARWIDDLVRPVDQELGSRKELGPQRAIRELRDAMARDEYVPKIRKALDARLEQAGVDAQAASRVRRLLELTQPAMAAECWGRLAATMPTRLINTQSLIVGVPSLGPGAERPSHFDRIDDQTAHCVSGQNLSPGDYPVGVAFPHPKQPGYFFQLVNLTSPRRQMANEYVAEMPPAKRLTELSRRTFAWMLARRKPLSAAELQMLRQLDRDEVSRFAGRYFETVNDEPMPATEVGALAEVQLPIAPLGESALVKRAHAGRPSRHGALCELLIAQGTRDAVPGLLRAVQSGRILPPTPRAPYRLDAIAVLAIAARDPSPESDAWLAELFGRSEPLVLEGDEPPALGATAGAILLKRHGLSPLDFGLARADEAFLLGVGVAGHRAVSPEALDRLRRWWAGRKEKPDGA